jgi:hypothetical protein
MTLGSKQNLVKTIRLLLEIRGSKMLGKHLFYQIKISF